jgi:hypothetical protein
VFAVNMAIITSMRNKKATYTMRPGTLRGGSMPPSDMVVETASACHTWSPMKPTNASRWPRRRPSWRRRMRRMWLAWPRAARFACCCAEVAQAPRSGGIETTVASSPSAVPVSAVPIVEKEPSRLAGRTPGGGSATTFAGTAMIVGEA